MSLIINAIISLGVVKWLFLSLSFILDLLEFASFS